MGVRAGLGVAKIGLGVDSRMIRGRVLLAPVSPLADLPVCAPVFVFVAAVAAFIPVCGTTLELPIEAALPVDAPLIPIA
jgi:hypothetical protein